MGANSFPTVNKPSKRPSLAILSQYKQLFPGGGALETILKYNPVTALPMALAKKFTKNLAENIYPYGYNKVPQRLISAGVLGRKGYAPEDIHPGNREATAEREDLVRALFNQPLKNNAIQPAEYTPSNAKDKNAKYYRSPVVEQNLMNTLYTSPITDEEGFKSIPQSAMENAAVGTVLGTAKIGGGQDEKGRYVSYYDKWDLNPVPKTDIKWLDKAVDSVVTGLPNALGLTTTPEVYGRIYLDETGKPKGYNPPKPQEGVYADGGGINRRDWLQRDAVESTQSKALRQHLSEPGFAQRQSDDAWNIVNTVGSFTPAWPLFAANQMGRSIDEGKYGQAGIEGAMIAAPYGVGHGLKAILPQARKAVNFIDDIITPKQNLYRVQPRDFNPVSTIDMVRNKVAKGEELSWMQHNILNDPVLYEKFNSRGKYHGAWYENDPKRLDYYLSDKVDENPIIMKLKLPKKDIPKYNVANYPEAMRTSLSPETEFIIPEALRSKSTIHNMSEWDALKKSHFYTGGKLPLIKYKYK